MLSESGGRANATLVNKNGTVDRGLFQINSIHARRVAGDLNALYDPETNVRVASQIHAESGWTPWVTYWRGTYKQYLNKDLN